MRKELLIRGHLGLGDLIVMNALVRAHSKYKRVTLLTKHHNVSSGVFMLRDDTNVEVVGVANDDEADEIVKMVKDHGRDVLCLGFYAKPFDIHAWDKEFYRQARVDFKERWNNFKVDRQPSREFEPPGKKYIFVHDDAKRGFHIDPSKIPKNRKAVRVEPLTPKDKQYGLEPCIFDWWGVIENAEEIHCMESSFAILVDSLPCLKAKRFVVHLYTRESIPPSYSKSWERIK